MSATLINLIVQLLSGAAGGNAIGGLLKQFSLGATGNTIAGAIGGGLGGQLLSALLGSGGTDVGSLISAVAGGGGSGAILTLIVGLIRQAMSGQSS